MITVSGEVKLGTLAGPLLIASPNHTDVITGGTLSSTSHVSFGTINCPINALGIFPCTVYNVKILSCGLKLPPLKEPLPRSLEEQFVVKYVK